LTQLFAVTAPSPIRRARDRAMVVHGFVMRGESLTMSPRLLRRDRSILRLGHCLVAFDDFNNIVGVGIAEAMSCLRDGYPVH